MKQILYINIILVVILFSSCNNNKHKRRQYNPAAEKQFKENLVKANKGLLSIDQGRISDYAKRRNWDMQKSKSGMWYQIIHAEQKNIDSAKVGKTAFLKYTVSLLDGTLCYSSDSTGILKFNIGHGGVEFGLEKAILLMKVGDKGRFILPPHLAHGLLGDENKIPLRTTIVYQIELIKLAD